MDTTMYDRLLKIPLFQGLSRNDLTVILEKIRIEFRSLAPDELLVKQDQPCREVIFVLEGTINKCTKDYNHHYTLCEEIGSETLIEPYSLFGMHPMYNSSYKAKTLTKVMIIEKFYILPLLCSYDIFNLNCFNLLGSRAQILQNKLWNTHIGDTLDRIVCFLSLRCDSLSGKKELGITMEALAELVDDTRLNVSRTLNKLQKQGYVTLYRKVIKINDLHNLILEASKEHKFKLNQLITE